ncbi:hypothetical protein QTP88_005647 [Uroleucon formosanum]
MGLSVQKLKSSLSQRSSNTPYYRRFDDGGCGPEITGTGGALDTIYGAGAGAVFGTSADGT